MYFTNLFRTALIGSLAILGLTAPISAQSRTETLRDLLAEMPAAVVQDGTLSMEFGDLDIGRQIVSLGLLRGYRQGIDFGILARVMPIFWGETMVPVVDDMPERLGFGVSDIDAVLVAQSRRQSVSLFRFPVRVPITVGGALGQADYRLEHYGDHPVWMRGEEDYSISLTDRDDVFGRRMGLASRIWLDQDLLRHTPGMDMMTEMIVHDSLRMTNLPEVMALVELLDDPALSAGSLATAQFHMGQSIAPIADALMIADLSDGITDRAILAFSFGNGLDALALRRRLEIFWPQGPGAYIQDEAGHPAGFDIISGNTESGRAWTALITDTPRSYEGAVIRNEGAQIMLRALFSGDLDRLAD